MTNICKKEDIKIKKEECMNIIEHCDCNIKKAVWCLELYKNNSIYDLESTKDNNKNKTNKKDNKKYIYYTNYDYAINKIVNMIYKLDINLMEKIRDIFFNTTITNFSCIKIITDITNKILECDILSEKCKGNIILKLSEISYNMTIGRRKIIQFDMMIIDIIKFIIIDMKENNIKFDVLKKKYKLYEGPKELNNDELMKNERIMNIITEIARIKKNNKENNK